MALIYIAEDDDNIREVEMIALKNSNHEVREFENVASFFKGLEETLPDLILLDIMLPDGSGYDVVRKLRSSARTKLIPVIMVTAKTSEIDMVKGLDDGADDYIKKPFSVMELLSRVRALLRRTVEENSAIVSVGKICMNNEKHSVIADGKSIELTYKEYELLRYLMTNEDIVLSRDAIMLSVWGTDYEGESRTVDMHIKTLRQKLGNCSNQIKTIRNVGYVISASEGV